jgi:AraC-like DNA-binding protein
MTRQFKRAYGVSPGRWQKIVAPAPGGDFTPNPALE